MYMIKHTDLIDANEPQLDSITEYELIQEPDEGRDAFIQDIVDNQEVSDCIYVIDDVSEEDIELEINDYFTKEEIKLLTELFEDHPMNWEAKHIDAMLLLHTKYLYEQSISHE